MREIKDGAIDVIIFYKIERLTGALLDRFTHHVHILEMNGESFRLKHSRKRSKN